MANELVIKINGDIKGFKDALDQATEKTSALSDQLGSIAKISGVAFAALTAEVGVAVAAFAESQSAANKLTQAMQNQGVYSDELLEKYRAQAAELQKLTGVDDDAIVAAQAIIVAQTGQKEVTQQLTQSVLDLAAGKEMDLKSSADLISKGINGHTGALKKLGIEISDHLDKEERTAEIIRQVTVKFGEQAAAANRGLGAIHGLKAAFGDFQEEIGSRFAPFIEVAIKKVTNFFQMLAANKPIMDFIAASIAAGVAVSGAVTIATGAATAFLALKAALSAAGIATNVMTLGVRALVGATGLGLLVLVAAEIYLNWNSIWPRMQAVFQAFVGNVSKMGEGLGKILLGVFALDVNLIKKGLDDARAAVTAGLTDYNKVVEEKTKEQDKIISESAKKQNDAKKKAADEENARLAEQEERRIARIEAEEELKLLTIQEASAQMLELKKAEIEALKLIEDEKFEGDKEALMVRANELRAFQAEQHALDEEQKAVFREQILATNEEFQAMTSTQQALFIEQNKSKLLASIETEKSARMAAAQAALQEQIKANNQYLLEQEKFGTAYAAINKVMHSEVYRGSKSAFGELSALQQSKSNELKAIGKAAAIANIIMKTAESAMNIYAGFSVIPIVGPFLGVAGAAAAIAFGAEQIGNVTAAAQGGIITGGIPNRDSVPAMLMPGELVTPTANFEEVIGSVRAQREAERLGGSSVGGGGVARIELSLKDSLMDFIEVKTLERQSLNLVIQGA